MKKMNENWPLIGMFLVPVALVMFALTGSLALGPGEYQSDPFAGTPSTLGSSAWMVDGTSNGWTAGPSGVPSDEGVVTGDDRIPADFRLVPVAP